MLENRLSEKEKYWKMKEQKELEQKEKRGKLLKPSHPRPKNQTRDENGELINRHLYRAKEAILRRAKNKLKKT